MNKRPSRLGKGLSALISTRETEPAAAPTAPPAPTVAPGAPGAKASPPAVVAAPEPAVANGEHIRSIPVDDIKPNPNQPRTTFNDDTLAELAASIRETGLLQPILVRPTDRDGYELVAGERRLRAAKLAGLKDVPSIVRELSDAKSLEIALIENLQREDLAPLERAAAYQHYLDTFGGTIEDLAKHLSESRANISNYLRLLKLHPEICFMLGSGQLGMGHARAIAAIPQQEAQLAIARLAARRNLSVRQVEDLVRQRTENDGLTPPQPVVRAAQPHLTDVEKSFSRSLGLRVRLRPGRKKNSGCVMITYGNLEEFDRIAERIGGSAKLD